MESTQNSPLATQGLSFIGVLDAIRDRRAIRHYTSQAVEKSTVKILLNYAVQAPSAADSQPWSFVVVQNAGLLKEISDEAKKLLLTDPHRSSEAGHGRDRFLNPDFNIFYDATTLIVICSSKEGRIPEADCYLAAQNLMLAAYGLGLGTCPIGLAWDALRTDAIQEKLGIGHGHFPVLPIAVGYASEPAERTSRKPPEVLKWIL